MVAECWTLDDTPPKLYTQPPTLPSTSGKFSSTNKSIDVDIHGFAFLNPLTVHLNAVVSNCLKKKKKKILPNVLALCFPQLNAECPPIWQSNLFLRHAENIGLSIMLQKWLENYFWMSWFFGKYYNWHDLKSTSLPDHILLMKDETTNIQTLAVWLSKSLNGFWMENSSPPNQNTYLLLSPVVLFNHLVCFATSLLHLSALEKSAISQIWWS